jgi:hypothetical protein
VAAAMQESYAAAVRDEGEAVRAKDELTGSEGGKN